MSRFCVIDAPIDCSGRGRGEELAPAALRKAGLLERLGALDGGVADCRIRVSERDPHTGVIGAGEVRRGARAVSARVRPELEAGRLPIVLGGDCTLLLGVFDALRPGTALCFVDGHADFYDGETSPTGEAADMDLAILTGHGPRGLLDGDRTLVDPGAVVLLGHRPAALSIDVATENARIDPAIEAMTALEIRAAGPGAIGNRAATRLGTQPLWLHIDLDVLDESVMPAVSYPQPMGLDWEELTELVAPIVPLPGLAGVSIADLNPEADPGGACTARTVELLAKIVQPLS